MRWSRWRDRVDEALGAADSGPAVAGKICQALGIDRHLSSEDLLGISCMCR